MLAQRLKYLRKHAELSQTDVATRLGIIPNSYSRYERGERMPDCETLRKLANFFDVSVDYLIGNDIGNPDTVELCNFLSCGSYTLDGQFPTAGDRTMLHNIVKAIIDNIKK